MSYDGSTGACCDASDSTMCYSGSGCCGKWGNGGCFYDSNLCSTNECGGDNDAEGDGDYDDATIELIDSSITPAACNYLGFYIQCAQNYSVTTSGSKMTLTPSSSAPPSCGVGTGDISGTLMLTMAR